MKFQNGSINGNLFWGFFKDEDVADTVIADLQVALGIDSGKHHQKGDVEDYVVAFKMHNKLYISKHNYHALVVGSNGIWHATGNLDDILFPRKGVLILSKDYLDELPPYKGPESFCLTMSELPIEHICVPLARYSKKT